MNHSIPKAALEIADACFELYSMAELEDTGFMVEEVQGYAPRADSADIVKGLTLAREWKRLNESLTYQIN